MFQIEIELYYNLFCLILNISVRVTFDGTL